ncbi:methyl-accepting chemotaxis protein [Halotalea alkalilenta]|uniref:Chemotaxis protein n=1 Tax=Halotalea alkalilenta TaxID=376489 RepID=A0A172YAK2_9GAMM|nr:methyl-accepting chemotaxis protein [Halotalea alkalilenta]ANF56250.1 hypothetical protein A5892_01205 [Halotalea alkalilenta]
MIFLAMIRRFTIRLRMLGAIGMVIALLILLSGAGLLGNQRMYTMHTQLIEEGVAGMRTLVALQDRLATLRTLDGSGAWREHLDEATRLATALEGIGTTGAAAPELLAALETYRERRTGGGDSGAALDGVQQRLRSIDTLIQGYIDANVAGQASLFRQILVTFFGEILLVLLIVVPLTLLNMWAICVPVRRARHTAEAIAGGDLTQPIDASGSDELTKLQETQTQMQRQLASIVAQIRDASENIAGASQGIADGNQHLAARTEQTANDLQGTVASLSQFSTTVQQTAQAAERGDLLSQDANAAAERGGGVIEQVVERMKLIESSSHRIGEIVGLIDEIAFQTNILAINASVEAARAGEQGRGFSVVAIEVQRLAKRSADAASEIKALTGESVKAVDAGASQVQEAGAVMREIVDSTQRVGEVISEISHATSEQSIGIQQVTQAMERVDHVTQQNASLVNQSAMAAASLREQAALLEQMVSRFRLDERGAPELKEVEGHVLSRSSASAHADVDAPPSPLRAFGAMLRRPLLWFRAR